MRRRRYWMRAIGAALALSCATPSVVRAQGALEKFGDSVFGPQNVEKYAADLLKVGEQLRQREAEAQQSSQRALTFLFLLRRAKSEQEWSIIGLLRPNFNSSWKYLIETSSLAGQQLQTTSFGKELPAIQEQSKKIVTDPAAAAEFALGEALAVGPYGRSAGDFFSVWQSNRKIAADDLERVANASKSGIIEKIEKIENKELLPISDPMLDCITGLTTAGGDILTLLSKGTDRKSRVIAIFSVPGGLSQLSDCIRKLVG